MKEINFSVIIPAAGVGSRAALPTPKQWHDLDGEPMAIRVLRKFVSLPGIRKVAVALHPDEIEERSKMIDSYKLDLDIIYCAGGKRRQDTVKLALDALEPDDKEIVVVHDAARPFVTTELIINVVEKAHECQAAIAAIPVADTIKQIDRVGFVMNTPKRSFLRRAQTPQAVNAGILKRGLELADQREIDLTDDAIAAELIGFRVAVVKGEEANVKITTSHDLEFANYLVSKGEIK